MMLKNKYTFKKVLCFLCGSGYSGTTLVNCTPTVFGNSTIGIHLLNNCEFDIHHNDEFQYLDTGS